MKGLSKGRYDETFAGEDVAFKAVKGSMIMAFHQHFDCNNKDARLQGWQY